MSWSDGIVQNIYTLISILNVPLAITVIFLERRNVGVTWAWLMVLLFLPVVGFVLYLFLGQNLSRLKLYRIHLANQGKIREYIERQRRDFRKHRVEFNDPAMSAYQDLIYMNLLSSHALYTQNNSVDIFVDGPSKFDSLFRDIAEAKHHIHLMYYIIQNDELGRKLIRELARKAEEGVEVRLLYDDIGSSDLTRRFFEPLLRAGGQAAAFFPSRIPYLNIRVNYRNHRKLAIIDGMYGYIGGFNVGDEYLGRSNKFGPWRDTHLRLRGDSVLQMQAQFAMDWNLASGRVLPDHPDYFPRLESTGTVGVQIVSSGPTHEMEQIKNAYIKMIFEAEQLICIQTPYFIPDESVLNALKIAMLSGVELRIMIPGKPDHRMVYWATYSHLGELLDLGAKCYLYQNGFLHAKTVIVDGKIASVGTANFDIRSFKLNFEVNAILYDTATVSRLQDIFERDTADCTELTAEMYRARSRMQRIKESCTRLISPIL
ncbi:cardiolipin synthase [Paenibacillus thermoaerophilus]|uniref:Cardiolipin synthase n=1 Tax=Paenibacillus thermoaerophilus TaxID=1215385 RepID=A0ABW2UYR3_9BACL|nr:cardiolipin synthase [Paenibacillus thermoaerophilus]TMV10453.1 cardiolipin synthase [Paenibacillus thermoaerophilus]